MTSRINNTGKNISIGLISYFVLVVFSFFNRTFFIRYLGIEYLGLNGLFNDILQFLTLSELGVGTAVLFCLYKHISDDNKEKICAYMNFYKKMYTIIGITIFSIGLLFTPMLQYFVTDLSTPLNIELFFILYILNTSISYFFSYKRTLLIADQRNFINVINHLIFTISQYCLQIIFLIFTSNYIIYLIIQIICTFLSNLQISNVVNKKYDYTNKNRNSKLSDDEVKDLKINIFSMMASKISSVVVTSTDSILISTFVSTTFLGLYSNYTMLIYIVKSIVTKISEGIAGSLGNYVVNKTKNEVNDFFYILDFLNFSIVSTFMLLFFILVDKFIIIWIGNQYIINTYILFFLTINMFFRLNRTTLLLYIDALGLFRFVRKKALVEAFSNIIISLILVITFDLGIYGILLGTLFSNLIANYFWEPNIIFKKGLETSSLKYHKIMIYRYICLFIIYIFVTFINKFIVIDSLLISFIVTGIIDLIIIVVMILLMFINDDSLKYYVNKIKSKI